MQQSKKVKKKTKPKAKTVQTIRKKDKAKTEGVSVKNKTKKISNNKRYTPGPFAWVSMWVTYIGSMIMSDSRMIPADIENKILISNNLYVTRHYMSRIYHVLDMGYQAPVTFCGEILRRLRERDNKCVVDFAFKNTVFDVKDENRELDSRVASWERTEADPTASKTKKKTAARCLYTADLYRSGINLKQTRLYITLRSVSVDELESAELILDKCIAEFDGLYDTEFAKVHQNLKYVSILGNTTPDLKSTQAVITTNQVLSQCMPNCGSLNDKTGYYLGQNIENGTAYYIDFSKITLARNIYVVALSGVGKTVLVRNLMQSGFEHGSAICAMDIKGNEYRSFIKATGGYIVSLRPSSHEYINTFAMHKDDCYNVDPEIYFNNRLNFSKQQMIILSGIEDKTNLTSLEALLDEFLNSVYVYYGAEKRNKNSWDNTLKLDPKIIYDLFVDYLTPLKMQQYNLPKSLLTTLGMYMSRTGSKSYVFTQEFDFISILNAPTISFDFGILSSMNVSDIDIDLFRLKMLYMSKLNSDFTSVKFNQGLRTLKILEESQIVSNSVLQMYAHEYTLSRARNQDTVLLGNSVQALVDNAESKAIIENTTCLLVGTLHNKARQTVIDQFSLQHLSRQLSLPSHKGKYANSFVLVNMMQDKVNYPIIKVQFDPDKPYALNEPDKEDIIY